MIKKILKITTLWAMGIGIAYAAPSTDATISTIVDGLMPQIGDGLHPLIFMISYLIGLFLGYKGVVQLREIGDRSAQKKPITVPIILLISSACLIALPTLVNTGITTLGFDTGRQETFKY